ncbi:MULTISPECIES: methyltransferase [Sphingomonas]|jgi:predicted RNA methylase|uniref:Methyltransferase small domain-containing protein n=1 Tax=Sphingomonas turrisvirgatae TaxID=1888892 RepID=A0A1E3M088_9SPHN|nr:methyltransferase [Sphingomonas turrisvirgatae]ODP38765.1 hypothetical protein BFL28_13270 [Sphingomonas turrisvirgatae]
MDAIYTPPDLADYLTASASLTNPASVADFAAGDGALLRAAAARWPAASLFGSDVDQEAVAAISSLLPGCDSVQHDFLVNQDEDGPFCGHTYDLILLNPPFSCRGNTRYPVDIEGVTHHASKALAFVARAIRFLAPGGEIIAIVPASVLVAERDASLLAALEAWGTVEQVGEVRAAEFKSHAVAVAVLRIAQRLGAVTPKEKPLLVSLRPFSVEISRGSVSMHEFVPSPAGLDFVHTTDMRQGHIWPSDRKASPELRRVRGPAVLVPRVGRPMQEKIVVLGDKEVVLSDCVMALRTSPPGNEQALAALLTENWSTLSSAYGGSCAPYTTLRRLANTLFRLGVANSIIRADRPAEAVRPTVEVRRPGDRASRRAKPRRRVVG